MNTPFRNLPGTPFQLGSPRGGDFIVRFLQAGKQFEEKADANTSGSRSTR